ncbi:S-layer homology domain-containing protein [Patescibacteria group bacterium]|nr:S-layer homology domain-containing protein [Patescibacteria group bacterium]MBU1016406.1 S-layer homology domain-containing protein [Patescibacteria group bacterium]MBU1685154.1 S-layer homology domain-containing protein [Patescibacteria group bacterium]MBU1938811.1 S-layer homology domain-containing protein [Patescibacteria group bacterium]
MNKKLFSFLALFSFIATSITPTSIVLASDDSNGQVPCDQVSETYDSRCEGNNDQWILEDKRHYFIAELEEIINYIEDTADRDLIQLAIEALHEVDTLDDLIFILDGLLEKIQVDHFPSIRHDEPPIENHEESPVEHYNNEPPAGYEDEVITVFKNNPFSDTDINSLSGKAAAELYRRAVIGGYPDGEFKGFKPVNRAEAAKFLLLSRFGEVEDVANNGQFGDVLDGQWYTKYVVTSANKGIIKGYADGLFKPADTVNTAEFLKMLSITFDLEENLPHSFADVSSDQWFAKYAGAAAKYKLFPERTSKLMPAQELTRAEVAVAIYQFLSNR